MQSKAKSLSKFTSRQRPADFNFWRSYSRFMVDNMAAAIVAADCYGRITIFNRSAEQEFNMARAEVLGKHLQKVFPAVPEHELYLLQALRTGRELKDVEYNHCPYTAREGAFVHNVALVKGKHGNINGAIWMRKDVTDFRRYQKELSEAEVHAIVSQIAAGTAHEIRNPLTTARGYVQLALSQSDKSRLKEYLALAVEEIDLANQIITDFLALVHPRAQGLQIVDLNELVKDLLQLAGNAATMVDIRVNSRLDEKVPPALLDVKQVKHALLNVLHNAIQAMPRGGELIVKTSYLAGQDEICVTVSDTGIGIPPENLNLVFSPFFSTKVKSKGLGLTLANRIVQYHNGRIEVQSSPGQGTTVRLFFPATGG